MRVFLNGDPMELSGEDKVTVRGLLRHAGINEERGIAVSVESEVVRRGDWDATAVLDGQRVEVLRAVQGG